MIKEKMRMGSIPFLNHNRWILLIGMSFLLWNNLAGAEDMIEVSSQPDIDQGREIYQAHCLECHGMQGHGDGPRATTLAPRPGNLVSAGTSSKTDDPRNRSWITKVHASSWRTWQN